MTEGYEETDFLVRVRAQVMARDESTEGWLPLQGGGLANVSIRKRARLPHSLDGGGHEYIIYGTRISDQTVILSCVINRDLQYFKVMPTFHHWRAGKQRNGLTFQTAADARAFDKGIIRAYDDLIDVGEDDVFMTLDLPVEPTESRTNSEGTGSNHSVDKQSQQSSNIHYISCGEKPSKPTGGSLNVAPIVPGDNYSYVQLTAVHDYNYPVIDEPTELSTKFPQQVLLSPLSSGSLLNTRRDSTSSLKKRNALDNISYVKDTSLIKTRLRCRYCQEFYNEEFNHKGSCEYAPDCFKTAIENVSGMFCARCMLYHCMKDSEGDTATHPCSCTSESGSTKRWIGLALLSLIVPCLWCYPPLRACHWIGVSCGICGGKHKPQI